MRDPLQRRPSADRDQMLGHDCRFAGERAEEFSRQPRMAVEKADQSGQRYWRNYRLRERPYRVERGFKKAAAAACEVPGQDKVEDLALPVAQEPVADRDPLGDQKYRCTPLSFADDFLTGTDRAADCFE